MAGLAEGEQLLQAHHQIFLEMLLQVVLEEQELQEVLTPVVLEIPVLLDNQDPLEILVEQEEQELLEMREVLEHHPVRWALLFPEELAAQEGLQIQEIPERMEIRVMLERLETLASLEMRELLETAEVVVMLEEVELLKQQQPQALEVVVAVQGDNQEEVVG